MSLNLVGKKKGMTRVFDEHGHLIACTVIEAEPNIVVQHKSYNKDGYQAIQLGGIKVLDSKKKNIKKPLVGHFAKAKVEPRVRLLESRVENLDCYELGKKISVEYFLDVKFVDVFGVSKGKGFQGVIKRHNFSGGPASHGSGFHRKTGSIGMRSTPGRCLPGKKMPGQMGAKQVVSMNLQIVKIDVKKQILLLKGAVPGARNSCIYIRKSIKKYRDHG